MIVEAGGVATVMAVVLAGVFLVAAVAKLRAPGRAAAELDGLGVPWPRLATGAVAVAELGLVGVLLTRPRVGAALALVVLAGFTAFVVRAILAGRRAPCGCLGSLSREPVSWATVARNASLGVMALTALAATTPVRPDLASIMVSSLLVLVAALAVQLLAVQQRIGRLVSVRLAGEPAGQTGTQQVSGGTR